jgi:hypothetical protein
MGSSARQHRQHLGLAVALAVCGLVSAAVSGSTGVPVRLGPPAPEFILARLAYNDGFLGGGGFRGRGGSWTTDAPQAEFHLLGGIRRFTRIDTIDPGDDEDDPGNVYPVRPGGPLDPRELDIFEFPFIYGVEVGRWDLDEDEAKHMRQYLLRGGFLMVDDFHGYDQWEGFLFSMERVFPEAEYAIRDIPADHEAFHVLYDLSQEVRNKTQIPGLVAYQFDGSSTCEQCNNGGAEAQWKGIFDTSGRLMVAINFNMDLGDAWEHADEPRYPQPLTALAYRFAISYALYAMTH